MYAEPVCMLYRICPGRYFADTTVWLVVANVLATFRIGPYTDPSSGREIRPEVAYLLGFTRFVVLYYLS